MDGEFKLVRRQEVKTIDEDVFTSHSYYNPEMIKML